MIENDKCYSKIILPDYKFQLDLGIGKPNYTIKNMIEDKKKIYGKEYVLTMTLRDKDGSVIANNNLTSMLTRLEEFSIDINHGEKFYTCLNMKYLGNNNIDRKIEYDTIKIDRASDISVENGIAINRILSLKANNSNKLTYRDLLNEFFEHKYCSYAEFHNSLQESKDKRVQKLLNLFFYLDLRIIKKGSMYPERSLSHLIEIRGRQW